MSVKMPRYIDAVTMGADVVGSAINVMGLRDFSFQAAWTGTPTGVWRVQVSNDGPADQTGLTPSGNLGWTDLTLTSAMIAAYPAGAAGDFLFEFRDMAVNFVRFWYDRTSSTGSLKVGFKGA